MKGRCNVLAKTKAKIEISETDKELVKVVRKVHEYKKACEANIVSILWKSPDMYYNYNLKLEDFTENVWRVYWQIGYDLVIKEKKQSLDEITVGLYLEKHNKLRDKYEEYGGFNTIENAKAYVEKANIDGYINELHKWNVVLKIIKMKFPVDEDKLKEFVDMDTEDIYNEYEAILNHLFISVEGNDTSHDIADGLEQLISELDKGTSIGLPYHEMPLLTSETNGLSRGNFYLLLGGSGTGKSSFCRNLIFPSILEKGEKICIIINEEDEKKTKMELLVWVANNIFNSNFQKYKMNIGNFSNEDKEILDKSRKWIEEHKQQIYIVPLDSYTTNKAIKVIKKYASLGVIYFILDTFKYDSNTKTVDNNWLDLQLNSVKLSDLIKPKGKNLILMCTMQLTKTSVKQRYLTQDSISGAKNVVDVASGCYMIRWLLPDEYKSGNKEIKVYKLMGKNKGSKIPVDLDENKRYQIIFIDKNRFGTAREFQIVVEVDLSRNVYKEVGICMIDPDW